MSEQQNEMTCPLSKSCVRPEFYVILSTTKKIPCTVDICMKMYLIFSDPIYFYVSENQQTFAESWFYPKSNNFLIFILPFFEFLKMKLDR